MKRTNLVLDDKLLEACLRASGEKTYSAAVQRAMEKYVRVWRLEESVKKLAGSGWAGPELSVMRNDHARNDRGRKRKRKPA